ncbi:MAG: CaiB/BaiF CoA transferase family protein [Pseudomonadales bacterium]
MLANDPQNSIDGMGAYFITLNRNKKSVCVDLKSERGLQLFYDLVKQVDIVFDNFSAGVTGKLKIDYQHLAEINPRVITCTVTGFGSSGPRYKRPAFDQVVQAIGGGMSITGSDPEHPSRAGIPMGDLTGGMFGVMGVLSALYERERSGKGQHVDVSMLDCQISLLNYMATMYFLSGQDPFPIGNSHFVHVPYNTFRTRDGFIVIAVIFDSFWENLVDLLDCEELCQEKYLTQPGRLADKEFIESKINTILATNTSAYWLEKLENMRIPCAPVNRFSEALADDQVLHRDMVVELKHPDGKSTKGPGTPLKLSRTSQESYTAAPLLGQDTDKIFQELLGYSQDDIEALKQEGVIG